MSGVWDHRQLARGEYEIRRDGQQRALITFAHDQPRPSLTIRQIVETFARSDGGTIAVATAGHPTGVDWEALGVADETTYTDLVDGVRTAAAALTNEMRIWVKTERARLGVPEHGPFSLDQLALIESLITRAPIVIDQDRAAEGTAA